MVIQRTRRSTGSKRAEPNEAPAAPQPPHSQKASGSGPFDREAYREGAVAKPLEASPAVVLPSLPLGDPAPLSADQLPENQPDARFAGKTPALARPADPLPAFLGGPLTKHSRILGPDPSVPWRAKSVMNPTAITKDGKVYLLVRAEDHSGAGQWFGTSRIGLAESSDGINFTVRDEPVLGPTEPYEAHGGCEDPRITEIDGKYYLTYTAFSYDDKMARLAMAVSDDLVHWEKKGPLFPDFHNPPNPDGWTKSGALLPQKVNGEYLMYFGDAKVFLARSKDLVHWQADPEPVLEPRPGYFDGNLVEPGPAPWLDDEGNVHLLYNGDAPPPVGSDEAGGYASGEVVFSGADPRQIVSRSSTPLLKVTEPDEMTGQVGNVLFLEGKAELNGKVFLYYGMADSYIGVAEAPAAGAKKA